MTEIQTSKEIAPVSVYSENSALFDKEKHERLVNLAGTFAKSNLVPQQYRNPSDCYVALHLAMNMKIDPIFYLQNTQPINGNISWKSPAVIAMINASAKFEGCLKWKIDYKDNLIKSCVAYIKERSTGDVLEGTPITSEMVQSEGWLNKSGSKWKTMAEQMYKYRAATFFARTYCPEVLLGMYTYDEIEDNSRIVKKEEKENIDFGAEDLEKKSKTIDMEDLLNAG